MTETFNPVRLQVARERRGRLGKELAALCGVTPQTVSNWESGLTEPEPDSVARISTELRFPPAFFFLPSLDRLEEGAPNFRARSKIAARDRRAAVAAGDLARELADWIERKFSLPPPNLPDLHGHPPELAAQVVRAEWMLGDKPAPNMIHLLESRGVLVFSLAQNCRDIDAFSFWAGNRPIVMLNTMKSAERSRVDAAHELFHLLAHKEETGKKEEGEADHFAGAFLLPEADVRKRISRLVGLNQLITDKRRWGVSLSALVYRLHKLGIITEWQYRTMFVELSKRGYRSGEPNSIDREGSSLLFQVFESLRSRGARISSIAAELGWPLDELHGLLFGLGATIMGIDGGGSGDAKGRVGKLRLV